MAARNSDILPYTGCSDLLHGPLWSLQETQVSPTLPFGTAQGQPVGVIERNSFWWVKSNGTQQPCFQIQQFLTYYLRIIKARFQALAVSRVPCVWNMLPLARATSFIMDLPGRKSAHLKDTGGSGSSEMECVPLTLVWKPSPRKSLTLILHTLLVNSAGELQTEYREMEG